MNTISGDCQTDEPPQFCGGIIADPMGLGKTLTIIALVAADMDVAKEIDSYIEADNQDIGATLVVVCPPSTLFHLSHTTNWYIPC